MANSVETSVHLDNHDDIQCFRHGVMSEIMVGGTYTAESMVNKYWFDANDPADLGRFVGAMFVEGRR